MGPIYVDPRPDHPGLALFQYETLTRVVAWLENAVMKRQTRLQLGRLGDDGLKDLGLTRDHVEADLENYFSA
ncbi:DUF1127 domain-containing protein [Phyllobacterium sp. LjRoot231]|uniref:DUF1127 domain-containing protein n=1 Tax=Phyllobacterium sp. LjRoot231 TaxID=3342289 RepID=UPI003ECF1B7D